MYSIEQSFEYIWQHQTKYYGFPAQSPTKWPTSQGCLLGCGIGCILPQEDSGAVEDQDSGSEHGERGIFLPVLVVIIQCANMK
jgi:hypothetical protein